MLQTPLTRALSIRMCNKTVVEELFDLSWISNFILKYLHLSCFEILKSMTVGLWKNYWLSKTQRYFNIKINMNLREIWTCCCGPMEHYCGANDQEFNEHSRSHFKDDYYFEEQRNSTQLNTQRWFHPNMHTAEKYCFKILVVVEKTSINRNADQSAS